MKKISNRMVRVLAAVSVLFILGAWRAEAGLIKVDQTIWGMDCAPCAYGMEKGLKKLVGIKRVQVSLNKGNAVIEFVSDVKEPTLADIRRVVRDSGFTPKEAKVKISGTLKVQEHNVLLLQVGEMNYVLKPVDKTKAAWQRLQKAANGSTITVTGKVPAGHSDEIFVDEALL